MAELQKINEEVKAAVEAERRNANKYQSQLVSKQDRIKYLEKLNKKAEAAPKQALLGKSKKTEGLLSTLTHETMAGTMG